MHDINWIAVIAATIAAFAVGAVWYSPLLFTKLWLRESKATESPVKYSTPMTFGGAFVLTLLATIVFALFLGHGRGWSYGALAGFHIGLFWVAGSFGVNYLFERRSMTLLAINGGYNVVTYTVMGTVLGAMS
jgi:Protein of unknown function (DUF1761)